jgi:hypothetical protein
MDMNKAKQINIYGIIWFSIMRPDDGIGAVFCASFALFDDERGLAAFVFEFVFAVCLPCAAVVLVFGILSTPRCFVDQPNITVIIPIITQ